MKNKSVLDCFIRINVFESGELTDLSIPCYIEDMNEPLILKIVGNPKGVSAELFLTDSNDFE